MLVYLIRLAAAIALFVGLFIDARQQPSTSSHFSWAGCISHFGDFARVSRMTPPFLAITEDSSGVVCKESENYPEPTSSRHFDPNGAIGYTVLARRWERRRGLWALTDHHLAWELRFDTDYPAHTDAEPPAQIREAAARWLRDNGWIDPTIYAKLRTGDLRVRSTDASARVHTILALALLVLANALFPWRQTLCAARWLFTKPCPGLCDECGYDLTGLRSHTCPECGEPLLHPIASLSDLTDTGSTASDASPPR